MRLGTIEIPTRAALALALGGVASAALAGVGLASTAGDGAVDGRGPSASAVAEAPVEVTVQQSTYVPGQSSGWHAHPGLHTVVVRAGTLTVYDSNCQARTYGPDEPYVGGRHPHLARNETGEPVEMMVVYAANGHAASSEYQLTVHEPLACERPTTG